MRQPLGISMKAALPALKPSVKLRRLRENEEPFE